MIDELNIIFSPLSDEEKRKRIKLAQELEILFLYLFVAMNESDIVDTVAQKYQEIVTRQLGLMRTTEYIVSQSVQTVQEVLRTTKEHEGEEYYTSAKRATIIAANEAHKAWEYKHYVDAVREGKTRKRWKSVLIDTTRPDHMAAHNQTVGIFDRFTVGDSQFGYPRDMTYYPSAEQVVNCLCTCEYF